MKFLSILPLAAMVVLTSCSSSKTAQSSDDPYYSPSRPATNYNNTGNEGEYYDANQSDQYLMMKVQDPNKWSTFDDYGYDSYYSSYSPGFSPYGSAFNPYMSYGFGFGYGFYNPYYSPFGAFGYWNPYFGYMNNYYAWNTAYNPYYAYGNVAYLGGSASAYNSYASAHPLTYGSFTNKYIASNHTSLKSGNGMNNNFKTSYAGQRTNNFNGFNRSYSAPQNRSYAPASFGGGGARFSGGGGGGGGGFGRH